MKKILIFSIIMLFSGFVQAEEKKQPICETTLQKLKPECNIGKIFKKVKSVSDKIDGAMKVTNGK